MVSYEPERDTFYEWREEFAIEHGRICVFLGQEPPQVVHVNISVIIRLEEPVHLVKELLVSQFERVPRFRPQL